RNLYVGTGRFQPVETYVERCPGLLPHRDGLLSAPSMIDCCPKHSVQEEAYEGSEDKVEAAVAPKHPPVIVYECGDDVPEVGAQACVRENLRPHRWQLVVRIRQFRGGLVRFRPTTFRLLAI